MIEKRIIIIAVLAVFAVILTMVRESNGASGESFGFIPVAKQDISGDEVFTMADGTLQELGISKKNIRTVKNKNDVRVRTPQSFDPIQFVKVMNDSLERYNATVVSMENVKAKSTVVQIMNKEIILKSFIFTKEPISSASKGASSSQQKTQTR